MGVNSLPKSVTRQRRDCDLNPGPSAPESSTLTTRLPSHLSEGTCLIGVMVKLLSKRWWIPTGARPEGQKLGWMCGCLFLNSSFYSYTFSLTVIIATGNQLDGLSLLEACQMSYDTGIVYLLW